MSRLTLVQSALSGSLQFLEQWRPLVSACMVDFISGDLWRQLLPDQLAQELLQLSPEQLQQLPAADPTVFPPGHVRQLCRDLRRHSLAGSGVLQPPTPRAPPPPYFDLYMQSKKSHEVSVMAATVAALAQQHGARRLVEIGSGRGYLGSVLALAYHLPVLSVEGNRVHLDGADKLNRLLQRSWKNIVARTEAMNSGQWRSGRRAARARRRSRSNSNSSSSSSSSSAALPSPPPPLYTCHCCVDSNTLLASLLARAEPSALSAAGAAAAAMAGGDNYDALWRSNCRTDDVALIGLHTCGDLSPHCLNMFVRQPCRLLVNVGCCYQRVSECDGGATYTGSGNTSATYPMSQYLRSLPGWRLGDNMRGMSVQPAERIAAEQREPNPTLYYRALLEVLLTDFLGPDRQRIPVGKLSRKTSDYLPYMRLALNMYSLNQQVSDALLLDYYDRYLSERRLLCIFSLLRSALAPVVEGVLLLDRLCYLLEQDVVESAQLIRLFDPVTSPRCYALVAWKSV